VTVQDFATNTLVLIGSHDPGETPSSSDSTYVMNALNRLLASWSAMQFFVHKMTKDTFSLTGAASYTIGPAATINTARPLKIRAAAVVVGNVSQTLEIKTAEQWAALQDKTRAGKFAKCLYHDGGYPTGTIFLTPTPAAGGSLELYSVKALSGYSTLGDTFDLPPGYEQALQFAVGAAIAPSFGRTLTPELAAGAQEAKQAIAKLNAEVLGMSIPAEAPQQ